MHSKNGALNFLSVINWHLEQELLLTNNILKITNKFFELEKSIKNYRKSNDLKLVSVANMDEAHLFLSMEIIFNCKKSLKTGNTKTIEE